jgi:hypothetical protein
LGAYDYHYYWGSDPTTDMKSAPEAVRGTWEEPSKLLQRLSLLLRRVKSTSSSGSTVPILANSNYFVNALPMFNGGGYYHYTCGANHYYW